MGELASYFVWIAVVVLAIAAGFLAVVAVRRWAHREERAETFTFQDLREMRARGEITEREFAAMRNVLLEQMQADLPPEPSQPESPPPDSTPTEDTNEA
ncbi:MAG: SHOCT domain-containing protein [Phycisphaerae bacterium]|nr:SHOCT domain-containing protein [Phycisphaerae bacterium]